MRYVELSAFAMLLACGQFLFKKAATSGLGEPFPWSMANGWMLAALCLYGAATGLWVWILRSTPISVAYPFAALGFVIVPLMAWGFLGETISSRQIIGTALIVAGIVISAT